MPVPPYPPPPPGAASDPQGHREFFFPLHLTDHILKFSNGPQIPLWCEFRAKDRAGRRDCLSVPLLCLATWKVTQAVLLGTSNTGFTCKSVSILACHDCHGDAEQGFQDWLFAFKLSSLEVKGEGAECRLLHILFLPRNSLRQGLGEPEEALTLGPDVVL